MADINIPTLRTFRVIPDVPSPLEPLRALSQNLWWTWNHDAAELFRRLDRQLWEETRHNPVKLLGSLPQAKFQEFSSDQGYLAQLERVHDRFKKEMTGTCWYSRTQQEASQARIAYFSAEFGLHESVPIYSGGLGVLAGDHLKSASELGVPLVGVGLLYRQGYFQQYLSADGWQQEAYPELDFYNLPVELQRFTDGTPVTVRVDLPDSAVFVRVWKIQVGRIPLVLLDTNVQENAPADRDITSRLYGGGSEMRIKQEIVLGIGGVRALEAMGIKPTVFHMNEGHSAFLALERIRKLLEANPNLSFDEVRQHVMAGNVFTTHTPVPAGIDMFPPDLITKYFRSFFPALKLDEEGFLALGREDVTNKKQGFSMAVLAIRLADSCNGVSRLHGEVSRDMWHSIWPGVPINDVPITHVTNGIHLRSWMGSEIGQTIERYVGDDWTLDPTNPNAWHDVDQIPDEELWRAHERSRERMVLYMRQALRNQIQKRGGTYDELNVAEGILDPDALTIGFARRFATYKRATLLLRDRNRLKALLASTDRPIQFVFAGKAHPADQGGKEFIRAIIDFARDPAVRRHFVFIENYDMGITRMMIQGVDVWLNTPRRPYEASGTSGMKASANGVLNLSVLDGWWVEGYELSKDSGFAIGRGETYADAEYQDHVESQSLYDILERELVPTFYKREAGGIPRDWIKRMKACLRHLAPVFNTNRMVAQYATRLYVPAHARGQLLAQDNLQRSARLAHAKDGLRHNWHSVKVVAVNESDKGPHCVGDQLTVEALVELGPIMPDQVRVQLYSGPVNAERRIEVAHAIDMTHTREVAPGKHLFTGELKCQLSGRHGYAVRLVPGISDLATSFEPGLITWG
jgi:starch phosphorylase